MKTIWKMPLAVVTQQNVYLPSGAQILKAENIASDIWIWFMFDQPGAPEDIRQIQMFGTGDLIPPLEGLRREYIDTVFQGGLVCHLFEVVTSEPTKEGSNDE